MAKKMSRVERARFITGVESRIFFPGFFRESMRLFGRQSAENQLAFTTLVLTTNHGKHTVSRAGFMSSVPALEDGRLLHWLLRRGLATAKGDVLSLCDSEGVVERIRFINRINTEFSDKLKVRHPDIWKILQEMDAKYKQKRK